MTGVRRWFRRVTVSALSLLVVTSFAAAPVATAAYSPFEGVDCSGIRESTAACQDADVDDPIGGSNGILRKAVLLLSIVGGAASVIIIVLSGIRYITSSGEANEVSRAKRSIIYASIGLIVILVAQFIITFVLGRINS